MHPIQTKHKFIALRAHSVSLQHIARQLKVSRRTLIEWNLKYQQDIANIRSIHIETLHQQVLPTYGLELSRLAHQLNQVESALAQRPVDSLSTESLFSLAGALRSQLRRHRRVPAYAPIPQEAQSDAPQPEYMI